MKSFDNWLKEQEQPASNFSRREVYEAGVQSRQPQIEDLRNKLQKSEYLRNEHLEARRRLYKDNCELQERIERAIKEIQDESWSDEYGDNQTPTYKLR